jgi:hypothetical protein
MKWKVSTNKILFDYDKARNEFEQNGNYILYQSRGKAHMIKEPKIGDEVVIICDKQEVLIGVIRSNFEEGKEHTMEYCKFSKKDDNNHRKIMQNIQIEIIGLGDMSYNRGVQRTWSIYRKI